MARLRWAGSRALRSIWAEAEKQEKKTQTVVPDVSGTERLGLTPSPEYSSCHQSYEFKGFNKELQCLCSAGRVTGPGFRPGTSETNQFWVTSTWYRTGIICLRFILVILYMRKWPEISKLKAILIQLPAQFSFFEHKFLYPVVKSVWEIVRLFIASWEGFSLGPTARAVKRLRWMKVKSNRSLSSL